MSVRSNPIQDPRQLSNRCQSSPLPNNRAESADCNIFGFKRHHQQQRPILDNIDINTGVNTAVPRRCTPYPPPYLARSAPSPSPSQSASSAASTSTSSMPHSDHTSSTQKLSERQQKFNYHYNLLLYMRHPQQNARIAYDAQVSAACLSLWCIFNMFFGFSANPSLQLIPTQIGDADPMIAHKLNIEKMYQRQEIFNNLLVFLIAILVIHKDIISANAAACLPLLLLFNFTVRCSFQYVIKFEPSWDSLNCAVCLAILWLVCFKFVFNMLMSKQYDIYWNLMRCHFFYRGAVRRWTFYVIYVWFNALMVLQLMDSVCLSDGALKTKLCQMHRMRFIGCDMVSVVYCTLVLTIWNRLQQIDDQQLKTYKLSVQSHGVKEIFIFLGTLILVNILCDLYFSKLVMKKMLLPFSVVVIFCCNFLMR